MRVKRNVVFIWLVMLVISVGLLTAGLMSQWLYFQLDAALLEPKNVVKGWLLPGPAILVLLVIIALISVVMIQRQFTTQHNQVAQVLKSLINRDTSMSLTNAPEIQPLLSEVQHEIGRSRDAAEVQASYLKALITQLDIAVIELDEEGFIEQSNPAAERLLGVSFIQFWHQAMSGRTILDTADNTLQQQTQRNVEALKALLQQHKPSSRGELTWHYPNRSETLLYSLINGFSQGKQRTLLTLQSIEKQLVAHEVKAYQQLVKVLTHEIANSITPMVSLTQSAQTISAEMQSQGVSGSDDLVEALATVSRRGQHLTQFIQSFKALSTPVKAQLRAHFLREQVDEVWSFMQAEYANVEVRIDVAPTFEVMLDAGLFEQVLINLLKNACEATEGRASRRVTLVAQHIDQMACLDIIDNGPGISEPAAASIFVPFFTTKSSGTGIGLPLARALMLSQGGNLLLLDATEHGHFRCVFG